MEKKKSDILVMFAILLTTKEIEASREWMWRRVNEVKNKWQIEMSQLMLSSSFLGLFATTQKKEDQKESLYDALMRRVFRNSKVECQPTTANV